MSPTPSGHEYLVVPAPRRAPKIKGVRDPAERFAVAVAQVMNEAGRDGWEYLRTDSLPMEVRSGWLGGRTVTTQELLVFRRALKEVAEPTPEAPALSRAAAPEARSGGAVTPLSLRPASQRSAVDPTAARPAAPTLRPEPDGGPGRPRLGGAARPDPRKG